MNVSCGYINTPLHCVPLNWICTECGESHQFTKIICCVIHFVKRPQRATSMKCVCSPQCVRACDIALYSPIYTHYQLLSPMGPMCVHVWRDNDHDFKWATAFYMYTTNACVESFIYFLFTFYQFHSERIGNAHSQQGIMKHHLN